MNKIFNFLINKLFSGCYSSHADILPALPPTVTEPMVAISSLLPFTLTLFVVAMSPQRYHCSSKLKTMNVFGNGI